MIGVPPFTLGAVAAKDRTEHIILQGQEKTMQTIHKSYI